MKRLGIASFCLALLVLATGAWAKGTKESSAAKPVELSFCQAQQLWGGSTDADLQQAYISLLEKKTNTKITMIAPPHNDYTQKLNVILASGDVPDLFNIYSAMKSVPVFARRGYLAAIDQELTKFPELQKNYAGIFEKVSVIDGKTYAVPEGRNNLILLYLRKDILDKAGAAVPTTTDEFAAAMAKVKGTGVIPLTNAKAMSYFRFFLSSFGVYDDIVKDASGRYVDGYADPRMKEAFGWLAKLYKDGLLDKEFVTTTTAQMREKFFAGKAAGGVYWDIYYTTFQTESRKLDPKADVVPVYRLKGPGGPGYTTDWGIDGAFGISAKSTKKEKALEIVNWLNTSEGVVARFTGVEGVHYTVDANRKAVPTEKAAKSGYAINVFNYIKVPFKVQMPFSFGPEVEALSASQYEVYEKGMAAIGPYFSMPSGKSAVYDRSGPSLDSKRNELSMQMIMGAMSVDQGFEQYAAFWKSIDGDKMLQELNQ